MWPWGHLAVGYLLYTLYTRTRYGHRPLAVATIFLVVGTQFPDLIDKPLSWTVGILPTGRTLAHSLLFAIPVSLAVYETCRRHPRLRGAWGIAFAIGNLSHVIVDALPAFLWGDPAEARFLLWPILSVPGYDAGTTPSIVGAFLTLDLSNYLLFEFVLFGLVSVVWWRDGRPGLAYSASRLLGFIGRPREKASSSGSVAPTHRASSSPRRQVSHQH